MQDYFTAAPEFIEEDNRQFRPRNPINIEYMTKKHRALFPDELVRGKSILDLGSCIGATGYWCLTAGASHYTGVEVQNEYNSVAERLLAKHFSSDRYTIIEDSIESFLNTSDKQYDIVSVLGVIYGFTDYYSPLKKIAERAKEYVLIEGMYPHKEKFGEDFCGVQFIETQSMNLASENSSLMGRGTKISPKGLEWIMKEFEFGTSELLTPEPIIQSVDVYNVKRRSSEIVRYMMRCKRTGGKEYSVSDKLQSGTFDTKLPW